MSRVLLNIVYFREKPINHRGEGFYMFPPPKWNILHCKGLCVVFWQIQQHWLHLDKRNWSLYVIIAEFVKVLQSFEVVVFKLLTLFDKFDNNLIKCNTHTTMLKSHHYQICTNSYKKLMSNLKIFIGIQLFIWLIQ